MLDNMGLLKSLEYFLKADVHSDGSCTKGDLEKNKYLVLSHPLTDFRRGF